MSRPELSRKFGLLCLFAVSGCAGQKKQDHSKGLPVQIAAEECTNQISSLAHGYGILGGHRYLYDYKSRTLFYPEGYSIQDQVQIIELPYYSPQGEGNQGGMWKDCMKSKGYSFS